MQKTAENTLTNGEALNRWRETDAGKAALNRVSPGEIAWGVTGAAGGGLLAYLLSKVLHRNASGLTRVLYTLAGAAGGAGGSQYLLRSMDAGGDFKGSLLEKMRLSAMPEWTDPDTGRDGLETGPSPAPAASEKEEPLWNRYDLFNAARAKDSLGPDKINLGAAAAGAAAGAAGKGLDFSGSRARQRAFVDYMNSTPGAGVQKALSDFNGSSKPAGLADTRGNRQLLKGGLSTTGVGSTVLRVGKARRLMDAAGNAGAAYLLGAAAQYAIDTYGAGMARVNPAVIPENIR